MQDLFSQKWQKFLSRIWPFKFIPFIDFVMAAGSLATGQIHENSDFDVIIGVKKGRIFSARFFCVLFFGILGWRRGKDGIAKAASDKFCFNHFVAPAAYRLSSPHNDYWRGLYFSLAPVYGEKILIQKFFDDNSDWMGEKKVYVEDKRYIYRKRGFIKLVLEGWLSGKLGDRLENKLKDMQTRRIKEGLESEMGYMPRIIFNDNELEFHPDTRRIEEIIGRINKNK